MDHFADERDFALLEGDRYTFFVLRRILGGGCTLLLTDHERLIICFSVSPYPVWIWTPDGAPEEEFERAYRLSAENGLLDGTHTFNLKYEPAEYFLRRAAADGLALSLERNMFAYDCPKPIEPTDKADGQLRRCTDEDLEELVECFDLFHEAIGIDKKDREGYRADARTAIESGRMFFWQNAAGRNVACCKYGPNGNMAAVNYVFTRPEYRRMHYAENMVYQVSCLAQAEGCLPMLYTNADYVPSNACYEKIGYILRGKLCTIG